MIKDRRLGKKILLWIVCSLIIQLAFYTVLEIKLTRVLSPEQSSSAVEFIIPSTNVKSPKLSPSKRYLAFYNNENLEVYDVILQKVIYRQEAIEEDRVLAFDWLPDRDCLLYIYRGQLDASIAKADNLCGTHLFTLEFNQVREYPEARYHNTITDFPLNAEVEKMVFSTYTNLVYLALKNGDSSVLLEIDVMKDSKIINRSQEAITNIAVSDESGILYVESSIASGPKKISAVNGWNRSIVEEDSNSVLLSCRSGLLYLGTMNGDILEEIRIFEVASASDSKSQIIWRGKLPFNDAQFGVVGSDIPVMIHESSLYLFRQGQTEKIDLAGGETYLSEVAKVIIKVWAAENYSLIKLIPIEQLLEI